MKINKKGRRWESSGTAMRQAACQPRPDMVTHRQVCLSVSVSVSVLVSVSVSVSVCTSFCCVCFVSCVY